MDAMDKIKVDGKTLYSWDATTKCYMCGTIIKMDAANMIIHNGTVNHLCGECWKKLERMVSRKGDDMPPVRGKY